MVGKSLTKTCIEKIQLKYLGQVEEQRKASGNYAGR